MRKKCKDGDVLVNAVSGTHVVLLGMDMDKDDTAGLLGFAIQREDLVEQETYWLRSSKSFPSVEGSPAYESFNSLFHPFQAFQWADYSAKPGYQYVYTVYPMYGVPGNLQKGIPTRVEITAEVARGDTHSIYFNRAAIASQAYSKRFGPVPPEQVGGSAFEWLARDLLSGMLDFVDRARDGTYALYGAIYEMCFESVLKAFRAAHLRGAVVKIIYDARPGVDSTDRNDTWIKKTLIKGLCHGRQKAKIMHNKFIVLVKDSQPVAVWTGSTNLSPNAIYGQLNVGHVIDDPAAAGAYLDYWQQLFTDPEIPALRDWTEQHNPLPLWIGAPPRIEVFSPHKGQGSFDWFIDIASEAEHALFMTFPFGIVKDFRPVFNVKDDILRYALLDKYVNGGNAASRQAAIKEIKAIRKLPNVGMALGSRIFTDAVDGWHLESDAIGTFVNWVHTKFMLVDPLGENPLTATGSANWSLPSMNQNDENMVVIRGDTRVADIYLTEFMRIFSHHRFRESVAIYLKQHGSMAGWQPKDLKENTADWLDQHYDFNEERCLRRRYFAQS